MSNLMKKLKDKTKSEYASQLDESEVYNSDEVVSTPIPALNLILSGNVLGGLHNGITVVAAPSQHFKTVLSMFMVSSYMKKYPDAICIFYDSEGGSPAESFKQYGIDPSRVLHVPVTDIHELRTNITLHLGEIKRGERVCMLIDSVGMLPSLKEVTDAENEKAVTDMSRAKDMKSLFRIIAAKSNVLGIPIIAINHTYETLEMFSKTEMSGGTGVRYSSNTVIYITKSQVKDGDELVGFNFRLVANKSRFVRERESVPLTVTFEGGIQRWSGMFDLAIEFGYLVSETKGWYQICDKSTGEILPEKKRRKDLENSDDLFLRLFRMGFAEELKQHYTLSRNAIYQGDDELDLSINDIEDAINVSTDNVEAVVADNEVANQNVE